MGAVHGPEFRIDSPPPIRVASLLTGAGNAAANTVAFQAAVAQAITNKTGLYVTGTAGDYFLGKTGNNPYPDDIYAGEYCVDLGEGTNGFYIKCAPGVALKLANTAMVGTTGYVHMFVGKDLKDFRVIDGTYDGNATGQTTWTGGYGAYPFTVFRLHYSVAGGGLDNIDLEGVTFQNLLGSPIKTISTDADYTIFPNGSYRCHRCSWSHYGEGPSANGFKFAHETSCIYDNSDNVATDDVAEYLACKYVLVEDRTGDGGTTGTQHAETSQSLTSIFRRCKFIGGGAAEFAVASTEQGILDGVDTRSLTFEDCSFEGQRVYGTAARTKATFRNCHFRGCGTSGSTSFQIGVNSNGAGGGPLIGCAVIFDGGTMESCGAVNVFDNGTLIMKNRPFLSNPAQDGITISYDASNASMRPTVDLDVHIRRARFGILIESAGGGDTFLPRGRIRGVIDQSTSADLYQQNDATPYGWDNIDVDVEITSPPQNFNAGNWVGKKYMTVNSDPGAGSPTPTQVLRGGSKGQIITLTTTGSQTLTNSASWQLTTASLTVDNKTTLRMEYFGSGVWREHSRVVGA